MTEDPELQSWREQWQNVTAAPFDLRVKVERQTRRMRIAVAIDVLVTIAMGGWTTAWAILSRRNDVAVLAAATWAFLAAAWTFAVLNLRGAWTPHELSTSDFLDISVRRCRARLRAVVFGAVLWVVEVGFCLGWIYRSYGALAPLHLLPVAVCTAVFLGACVWYYGRQKSELTQLLAMGGEAVITREPVAFRTRRRKVLRRI